MKIKEIRLKGFGKFAEGFSIRFDSPSNINVIVGHNEAGKSTLASSIYGILFGFQATAEEEKYNPWASKDYWGALYLQNGVREYKIERDFSKHIVRCKEIESGSGDERVVFEGNVSPRGRITDEKEKYYALLNDLLGFSEGGIFKATLFINQNEMVTLQDDEMAGKIRQFVSGSLETDYDAVLRNLRERYFDVTKSNPWGRDKTRDRPLELAQNRIQELKAKLVEAERGLDLMRSVEAKKDDLTEKLERCAEELERFQTMLRKVEEYRLLENDVRRLKETFSEYEDELHNVTSLNRRLEALSDELQDSKAFEKLPENSIERANEMEALIAALREKREKHKDEEEKLNAVPAVHITRTVIACILSFALAAALSASSGNTWVILSVTITAFIAAFCVMAWKVISKSVRNEARQQIKGKVDLLKEEVGELERKRGEISNLLKQAVGEQALADLDRFKRKFSNYQKALQQKREIALVLERLSDEHTLTSKYNRTRQELKNKEEQFSRAFENATYLEDFRPEEEENYRRRVASLGSIRDELQIKVKQVEQEYWSMGAMDANVNEIEDELEQLEEDLNFYRKRAEGILTAIDVLNAAKEKYQESYLDRFCETVSQTFRRITDSKYTKVGLSESSMEPVVSGNTQEKISVYSLSAGAQDQLYFSIRLALIKYLTNNRSLPVILDDPFVTFDRDRLQSTQNILEEVAKTNQVLLFTHDRRYLEWQSAAFDFDNAPS